MLFAVLHNNHDLPIAILTIPRSQKFGGQRLCDYTIYGSKLTIHNLMWYNHSVTVRQLFVCKV